MNKILQDSLEIVQGSAEWKAACCGSLGASGLHDALARTKSGWGAGRNNVMARLIVERLTGIFQEGFVNESMQHGINTEPDARLAYEMSRNVDVVQVGLIRHPSIRGTHASPDGLIGTDGVLECKCPNTATHLETLLGAPIPAKYVTQMNWQLSCCTGREWVDFVSYDPRMPEHMRLFVKRHFRDNDVIAELEESVRVFLAELDEKMARLRTLYIEPLAIAS